MESLPKYGQKRIGIDIFLDPGRQKAGFAADLIDVVHACIQFLSANRCVRTYRKLVYAANKIVLQPKGYQFSANTKLISMKNWYKV